MNQDIGKIGHILIVNSDPMMRQTVSGYFSEHNFPTSCASDWSELKCTGTPPCLIILNQPLGLNDGLDRVAINPVEVRYSCHHDRRPTRRN